jgi:uncharacterized protein with NAD-binding domain and iron-sulfur cluster
MSGGKVTAVHLRDRAGNTYRHESDFFVSAMPVEKARTFWTPQMLAADPSLANLNRLHTDWMVGIQYYLRKKVDLAPGHLTFIDSPWALTALSQGQFWKSRDFAADYGDGSYVDCLSVDISNWDAKGILYGKTAKECSAQEVADEVLAQIRYHHTPAAQLGPDVIGGWHLDPGVQYDASTGRNSNETPLLVNTAGSWKDRPEVTTKIPNFLLAGDFCKTNIDLATMEGANESGRKAANAILEKTGSTATPATIFKLWENPSLKLVRQTDAALYKAGLPNLLDVPVKGRF